MSQLSKYLTVPEAAAELGVSRQRVGQIIQAGRLPAERVGRIWLVPLAAVEAVKRSRELAAAGKGKQ